MVPPVAVILLFMLLAGPWTVEPCPTHVCDSRFDNAALLQGHKDAKLDAHRSEGIESELIPRKVFVTAPDSLDPKFLETLKANVAADPGISKEQLFVYNDERMAESVCRISKELESLGVADVYEAFSQLRPGAYKADLWRYMALWDHGGVYMDVDLRLTTKLDDWIDFASDRLVLVKDRPPRTYWNALMAAPPRHPALLATIEFVCWHVRHLSYGRDPLGVTGPSALYEALAAAPLIGDQIEVKLMMEVKEHDYCGHGEQPVCPAQVVKIAEPQTVVASESMMAAHNIRGPLHYSNLYREHEIYCFEPGPPCIEMPGCK